MTPVWIAITGLGIAVAGLLVTLVVHLVNHAYKMGIRDQRIASIEEELKHAVSFGSLVTQLAEKVSSLERDSQGTSGVSEAVIRLDERVKAQGEQLTHVDRTMQGMSRQLANLATGRGGVFQQAE